MVFQAFNEWHNGVGLKENPKRNEKLSPLIPWKMGDLFKQKIN